MKFQLALVLLLAVSCFAAKARYDNYKLFALQLNNTEQLEALKEIEDNTDSYDFWSALSLEREVLVMVPPHKFGDFEDLTTRLSIENVVRVENIQKLIDEQDPQPLRRDGEIRNVNWLQFNNFLEITTWLDSIVSGHPAVLESHNIGTSHQGRPIRAIRYSERAGNPAIFIEANIHAREWISSATALYLINELVYSTDPATRNMAQTIDWYIVPISNPDGFVFSHESTRMWRKTRQSWGACIGTDPNRNFDFFWMSGGASNNPCSDTYGGPQPFSEPETHAIRTYYGTIASRVRMFLSFHAFGQYLLMPYGHVNSQSNNHPNLMSVATAGANAIRNTYGRDYLVGSTAVVLYTASGSSPDWAFGVHNTRLAYTLEFRDIRGGSAGFLLPPNQIIPNCEEVMNGIKAMVAQARVVGEL